MSRRINHNAYQAYLASSPDYFLPGRFPLQPIRRHVRLRPYPTTYTNYVLPPALMPQIDRRSSEPEYVQSQNNIPQNVYRLVHPGTPR